MTRPWSFPMTPKAGWILFGAVVFVLSSLWLVPLSVVAGLSGLSNTGLAARTVDGTAWKGRMFDVSFMGAHLGDLQIKVLPLALFGGTARLRLVGAGTSGEVFVGISARGLRNVDAALIPGRALRGLSVESVRLVGLSMRHSGTSCTEASGQMTAYLASGPLARAVGPQLSGPATCANGNLSFRLTDVDGKVVFSLEYPASSPPRFTALITPTAVIDRSTLSALGFVDTPVGFRKSGPLSD